MFRTAAFVSATLLVIALAPLSYGYYTFLPLVVCATTACGAVLAAQSGSKEWAVGLGLLALVFNPVMPVYLSRGVWAIIDVVAAVIIAISAMRIPGMKST